MDNLPAMRELGDEPRQSMAVGLASGGACMDLGLAGKRVLVTGGSRGIGFAIAQRFLAEGARVAICARSPESLAAAATRLDGVTPVAADLTDPDAARQALDQAEAALGPLDILVNSAGAAKRSLPDELTPAHWRAALDAKFFSYINVIDPLIQRMAGRGGGVIVNIIGIGGKVIHPTHITGGAANAALMAATVGLARAFAARGVRVFGINPGLIATDRVAGGMAAEARLAGITLDDARQRARARIPAGRLGEPEDVANLAVMLASDKVGYASGALVSMDGAESGLV
jgi:NAD(P)-dependent dehydrogenase (short-subunit alcohol dehydrogenase family)